MVPQSRLVHGYGRGCATLLGLIGRTKDIGQDGPDLFHPEGDDHDGPRDHCDG